MTKVPPLLALLSLVTLPACTGPIAPQGGGVSASPQSPAPSGARRIAYYRSPMNPGIRSDKPAKDDMGMDYVPVYADEMDSAASVVQGRAVVVIPLERRQLLGVRSAEMREEVIDQTIRTVGRVAVDERRLHHVHTKYEGYIEHLYVDFTGRFVKAGEPLLSIYSPDLVATQQEYLLAFRHRARQAVDGVPAAGTEFLLEAARQRLLQWDVRAEDIARLEQTGEVRRTLDLYAEVSGYVVQKMAVHGMKVSPGDSLFDIADLSLVWVLADIYEYNLSSVLLGTRGEVRLPTVSDRTWTGVVTNVAPTLEEKTRTIKVRLEIENVGGLLRPDMFADVFLRTDRGRGIVVPEGAVIDAGDRRLVFLDRGEGRFEPREVKLGIHTGRGWQVLSGVAEGDRVVTTANFLLDSESSLNAALSSMTEAGSGHAGH